VSDQDPLHLETETPPSPDRIVRPDTVTPDNIGEDNGLGVGTFVVVSAVMAFFAFTIWLVN
jgi:hypothetical protein